MLTPTAVSAPALPFELETQLERDIVADPEWLGGIERGRLHPLHPGGKGPGRVQDVLNNIDHFFGCDDDRALLRLIALVCGLNTSQQPQGDRARKLAGRHRIEPDVLEVAELYSAAYEVSSLMSRGGNPQAAERCALELIERLGSNLGLFMKFFRCVSQAGSKCNFHYLWLRSVIRLKHFSDRLEGGENVRHL
jgi:hypothetical protein